MLHRISRASHHTAHLAWPAWAIAIARCPLQLALMSCGPVHGLAPAPKEQRWVSQVQLWLLQWRPLKSPSFPRHSVAVHQYVDTAFLHVFISTRTDESQAGLALKQLRELESCPRTSFPTPSHSTMAALMLPTAAQRQGHPSPPPYVPYLRSWDTLWHSVGV